MGTQTGIAWCDHTFNPWVGCTKISDGCDHCYAEVWSRRAGSPELWAGERRRTVAANWRLPLTWDAAARAAGVRRRVFCASLADVFDNRVPDNWRADLWDLISLTRGGLDWLLLTKRPQNIAAMLPQHPTYTPWPWPHVWLGTMAENQAEADRRIPHLLQVPARVHFLSCEPLLSDIDIAQYLLADGFPIHWVIAGGESGPHARPSHPDWFRSLRDQCSDALVPFFFKQWGEWRPLGPAHDETDQYLDAINGADEHRSRIVCASGHFHEDWEGQPPDDAWVMERVGKKRAGNLLDGYQHTAFPVLETAP